MTTRKRILVGVSLLCALALGGRVLVATPRPEPESASTGSPSLAGEPRRSAPAASGAMAAAVAVAPIRLGPPSAPAGNAADDGRRCGIGQEPQYAEPEADAEGRFGPSLREIRAAEPAYTGAMWRIDAALRASDYPFGAAVADALNVGDQRTPADRADVLALAASLSRDPRVYTIAFAACDRMRPGHVDGDSASAAPPACDRLDARSWAVSDPGNGVPWLYALQQADEAGDAAGQREALDRLAAMASFKMRFHVSAAAVARLRLPDQADLHAQFNAAAQTFGFQLFPPFLALTSRCRDRAHDDATMATTCAAIATALFESSDSILARAIGGSLHRLVTGDASWLDRAHQEQHEFGERWAASERAATSPCDQERRVLDHFVQMGERGEVAVMKSNRGASSRGPQ